MWKILFPDVIGIIRDGWYNEAYLKSMKNILNIWVAIKKVNYWNIFLSMENFY